MNQIAVAPLSITPKSQLSPRSIMIAVGMASFASLLLELALTRLFSVVLFYHFAFFAISVALLGLGSGGVTAHLWRAWFQRRDTRVLGSGLCLAASVLIFTALEVVVHTPVSLEISGRNFVKLTILYLVTTVPY